MNYLEEAGNWLGLSSEEEYILENAITYINEEKIFGIKIDKDKLDDLKSLDEINQQTPLRVLHRRADKTRVKHVLDVECEVIDDFTFNMKVKTQGGLYIKELISGDEGRTEPNVGEILGVGAKCEQLDVIEVSEK